MSTALYDPIKTMSRVTDEVLVGFSGGKDSIVTLDLCMRYFRRVQPFFLWQVPDMSFQQATIRRYERKYGVHMIQLPHFEVSDFLRYGTYRNDDPSVPTVSVTDVYHYLRLQTGIWWIAAGEHIADSIWRRAMIGKSGSIDDGRGRFYPLAYWKKADVLGYMKHKGLVMGAEYEKIGHSFRSLDAEDLRMVRDHYPADWQRLLTLYPLAETGIRQRDLAREKYDGNEQVSGV